MPAHFTVTLDTTPPVITFGEPEIDGTQFRIPVTFDESIIEVEAELRTPDGGAPLAYADGYLVGPLPAFYKVPAYVWARAVDEVFNTAEAVSAAWGDPVGGVVSGRMVATRHGVVLRSVDGAVDDPSPGGG